MQASGPIDGNVRLLLTELHRSIQRSTGIELTKFKEAVKDGTICRITGIEALHGSGVLPAIVGRDFAQEGDVVVGVELRQFAGRSGMRAIAIHLLVKTIGENEVMRQFQAMWLHRVGRTIVEERLEKRNRKNSISM
jgi:hypothetical protein